MKISDNGAIALGATLRMNRGLTELDIGGNKYVKGEEEKQD